MSQQASLPEFSVGNVHLGGDLPFLILGPCVIESETFMREAAEKIFSIAQSLNLPFILKASYDKANRSSVHSYRGLGCEDGCRLLRDIGADLGVPVTTDVHTSEEATIAGEYVDILQIPAFLSRQTDLLEAAAKTGRTVNVKKGQFMSPWDIGNIVTKMEAFGAKQFFLTERGASFGYQNLVADMRSIPWMQEQGARVIFDATHSVQRPGGQGTSSGGDGYLAPVLARSALAAGCDGVFLETHPNPAEALSDGPNQVPFEKLAGVLEELVAVYQLIRSFS